MLLKKYGYYSDQITRKKIGKLFIKMIIESMIINSILERLININFFIDWNRDVFPAKYNQPLMLKLIRFLTSNLVNKWQLERLSVCEPLIAKDGILIRRGWGKKHADVWFICEPINLFIICHASNTLFIDFTILVANWHC